MEIRAASPGSEGARAARDLFRIYREFASGQGWRVQVLGSRPAADGEFREVIANIEGKRVFAKLRFEAGLHRIQHMIRQEGRDRVRTLLVHIDILPLPPATEPEFEDTDLSVTCFRLARPGPDNIDGADSITRVTHLPTGLETEQRNDAAHYGADDRAMGILRARVFQHRQREQDKQSAVALAAGHQKARPIRTYNIPQGRISDRRTGLDLLNIDDVVSSKALATVIEALIAAMPEKDWQDDC